MRIPLVLMAALFLATVPLGAQDLQFRMRTTSIAADSLLRDVPLPVSTISIKGKKVRMDVDWQGGSAAGDVVAIMDDSAGRAIMMMPEEKAYIETTEPFQGIRAVTDSLNQLAQTGLEILRTGERRQIGGYDTERVIYTMPMTGALPATESRATLIIMEMWVVQDSVLAAAYRPFAERSVRFAAKSAPGVEVMANAARQFSLRTTNLIVAADDPSKVDVQAVLRNPQPVDVVMGMVIEVDAIKLGPLPDSLFQVPAGYRPVN